MPSSAVRQAITILEERLAAIGAELAGLHRERSDVQAALAALDPAAAPGRPARPARPAPPPRTPQRRGLSMRDRVLEIMVGENRSWTPAEVLDELERLEQRDPDKTDDQIKSTIRTAFWQLRNEGMAEMDASRPGASKATKWSASTSDGKERTQGASLPEE